MKQMIQSIVVFASFFLLSLTHAEKAEIIVSIRYFGAVGDGVTDDTEAIQKAIDSIGKTGGTLLFPPGTYMVSSVGLHPGVRYLGYGATIKRPAKQGKWNRTFNAAKQGYLYSGDEDSAPITVEGLTFDGNLEEQGDYRKYQLEQAHLLFFAADKKRAGRLKVRILNCHFKNQVADGISLYTNVDAQITNCTARDCFRGGVTITGGYSRIQIQNFSAQGKIHRTGIDVEVDGAGYGDTKKIELAINGLSLPDGDFDIGVSEGSIVLATNIVARAPFNLYALDSTIKISNSMFGVGRYSGAANRIVHPGDVTFQNCRFKTEGKSDPKKKNKWTAAHVYWNLSKGVTTNQTLRFLNCDFEVGEGISEKDITYAVYCEADIAERNNKLILSGGSISPAFDQGVFLNLGGNVQIRDVSIESVTPMHFGSSEKYPINVLIDGVQIRKAKRYANIPTHFEGNRFTHRNVDIDESLNFIVSKYGITGNQFLGRRVIHGEKSPTDKTHGLPGDVFRLKKAEPGHPYEWICTKSGIGKGAVWKVLTKVGD